MRQPTTLPMPPVDMEMPATAQTVTTIAIGLLFTAGLLGALWTWRRTGSPNFLLLMLGGLIAVINEPMGDILVAAWHPRHGQWTAFETFGRPMPVWLILVYPVFFGSLTYLNYSSFSRGATVRRTFVVFGVACGLNAALEIPMVLAHMYEYYGYQPYKIAGLAFPVVVLNQLGPLISGFLLAMFPTFFTGARLAWVALLPLLTNWFAYGVFAPHFSIINTDASPATKYAVATLSIVLTLVIIGELAVISQLRFARAAGPSEPALAVG